MQGKTKKIKFISYCIRKTKLFMKKFRTVASVIIMVIAGIVGFFIGAFLNEPMAGTILFSMIAGIACIVYAIDNHEE